VKYPFILTFIFTIIFLTIECNHGLSPSDAAIITGISGIITYEDNWPPADSLLELRLVAFKKFPPQNVIVEVLTGEAIVYPPIDSSSLNLNVNIQQYLMELPPDTFEYIVVAQQFGSDILNDWRAVGQYDTDSDSLPTAIIVEENDLFQNINIHVDFENLPIQPF
jgi:hypothetical protein